MRSRNAGFTLIEVLCVIGLTIVCATVAIVQLKATRTALEAQTASNQVVAQMSYARQVAIDQRRNVQIEFIAPSEIKVTRLESGGGTTVLSDIFLTGGFTYALPSGGPPDTPEHFGNATAIAFNGGTGGTFLGDGTFIDAGGIVLNGTVFTNAGGLAYARAVTLTGATGRILQYQLRNSAWAQVTQ